MGYGDTWSEVPSQLKGLMEIVSEFKARDKVEIEVIFPQFPNFEGLDLNTRDAQEEMQYAITQAHRALVCKVQMNGNERAIYDVSMEFGDRLQDLQENGSIIKVQGNYSYEHPTTCDFTLTFNTADF